MSFVLNVNSVISRLSHNTEKMCALNVEEKMDDKKFSEGAKIRVAKAKASELHRKARAKDSFQCYLAYMSLREKERNNA